MVLCYLYLELYWLPSFAASWGGHASDRLNTGDETSSYRPSRVATQCSMPYCPW